MIPNKKHGEATRNVFMSSIHGLANTLAVVVTFLGTPALYGRTIGWVQAYTASNYGYGLHDLVGLVWGCTCAALVFFVLHDINVNLGFGVKFKRIVNQNFKDRRAVSGLTPLLRDAALVKQVVIALGHIGDPQALPGLVRIISARKYPAAVLEKTFWAIGKTRSKSAVKTLVRFLKDPDPKVVIWTAAALGAIRDRRAAEPLFKVLSRPEKEVRLMVIWALEKISGKRFGDDVKRWEQWIYAPDRLR